MKILFYIVLSLFLFSCNKENNTQTDNNTTDTLDDKIPSENLLHKDNLFLDYQFGMNIEEVDIITEDLIKLKKIRKNKDELFYDIFYNEKYYKAKMTLNTDNYMYPNILFNIILSINNDNSESMELLLIGNKLSREETRTLTEKSSKDFEEIKKMYTKKYGEPKISEHNFTSLFSDIHLERYKDLKKNYGESYIVPRPITYVFTNEKQLIHLKRDVIGNPDIFYFSKSIVDKIENDAKNEKEEYRKNTLNDI